MDFLIYLKSRGTIGQARDEGKICFNIKNRAGVLPTRFHFSL